MPIIIKSKQILSVLFILVTIFVLTFTFMSASYGASEDVTPEMKIRSEQLLTSNKLDISQECMRKIVAQKPPINVPCTSSYSHQIESQISVHCQANASPIDTLLATCDPNLYGTNQGGYCYVCCG